MTQEENQVENSNLMGTFQNSCLFFRQIRVKQQNQAHLYLNQVIFLPILFFMKPRRKELIRCHLHHEHNSV